jgi:hypothetical protein
MSTIAHAHLAHKQVKLDHAKNSSPQRSRFCAAATAGISNVDQASVLHILQEIKLWPGQRHLPHPFAAMPNNCSPNNTPLEHLYNIISYVSQSTRDVRSTP